MHIPEFNGGWSYTQREMEEFFKHVVFYPKMAVLEFGSGDSTVKLYNHFKCFVEDLTFYTYESNPNFIGNHQHVKYMSYAESNIDELILPEIQFDIVLIDGPNGDKRSKWYSKIKPFVKTGTIILVDDFNHYACFGEELDKHFKYDVLSFHDEPFVAYGEHSWKIVRVVECL